MAYGVSNKEALRSAADAPNVRRVHGEAGGMPKRVAVLILVLLVAALVLGCSTAAIPAGSTDDTGGTGGTSTSAAAALVFRGKYGMTFNYPLGWTVVASTLTEVKTADGSTVESVRLEKAGVGLMDIAASIASQNHDPAAIEASNKASAANFEKLIQMNGGKVKKVTVAGMPGIYFSGSAGPGQPYNVVCMAYAGGSSVQPSGQTTSTAGATQTELGDAVSLVMSTIKIR